ncbi:hypothetical protein B0T09DRAFT_371798 [Sordaria sp. MPI-SDFR-AT-0083]|nr:hypothetical protein B0T09DRAFT_371798 [Sordaria sp. MPI-SDFR-AT-0083]
MQGQDRGPNRKSHSTSLYANRRSGAGTPSLRKWKRMTEEEHNGFHNGAITILDIWGVAARLVCAGEQHHPSHAHAHHGELREQASTKSRLPTTYAATATATASSTSLKEISDSQSNARAQMSSIPTKRAANDSGGKTPLYLLVLLVPLQASSNTTTYIHHGFVHAIVDGLDG